jgi:hypothetical protein
MSLDDSKETRLGHNTNFFSLLVSLTGIAKEAVVLRLRLQLRSGELESFSTSVQGVYAVSVSAHDES